MNFQPILNSYLFISVCEDLPQIFISQFQSFSPPFLSDYRLSLWLFFSLSIDYLYLVFDFPIAHSSKPKEYIWIIKEYNSTNSIPWWAMGKKSLDIICTDWNVSRIEKDTEKSKSGILPRCAKTLLHCMQEEHVRIPKQAELYLFCKSEIITK